MLDSHSSADALLALVKVGTKVVPAERCRIFWQAKLAYLLLHPETGCGGRREKGRERPGPLAFVPYAAQLTGYSLAVIADDIAIWDRLSRNARFAFTAKNIPHTRRQLQWLSDLIPAQQDYALIASMNDGVPDLGAGLCLAGGRQSNAASGTGAASLSHIPTRALLAELRRRGLQPAGGGDVRPA